MGGIGGQPEYLGGIWVSGGNRQGPQGVLGGWDQGLFSPPTSSSAEPNPSHPACPSPHPNLLAELPALVNTGKMSLRKALMMESLAGSAGGRLADPQWVRGCLPGDGEEESGV